jgi:dTDP-4-amino-4,6-dideoxygalactose transaminase
MVGRDYLPFGRPDFGDEEIAAVTRMLRSAGVGMGAATMASEEELAVGAPHVVTVNSCASVLLLSLPSNPTCFSFYACCCRISSPSSATQ